jgi:CRISPR/Cas system-associated exonuclease Cas4 (RecB family)
MDLEYLRPTGINCFLDCSAKFYFQEIEQIETPNKSYLAFGSSIHKTMEVNFSQKIDSKIDLSIEEAKQVFSESFDSEFQKVDKLDLASDDSGSMKDQGVKLIEKYQRDIAPRIQPVAVEQRIKVKFKGYDYGIAGTIDLYDADAVVIDHKTTSKQISGIIPENYKRQLSCYSILEEATGREVKSARIDYFKRDSTEIRHLAVPIDREHFLQMFQTVGEAIQKGIFIPNRSSFLCSKRYCKFYQACEDKYSGKVKD